MGNVTEEISGVVSERTCGKWRAVISRFYSVLIKERTGDTGTDTHTRVCVYVCAPFCGCLGCVVVL